jgi:hypothetical protein
MPHRAPHLRANGARGCVSGKPRDGAKLVTAVYMKETQSMYVCMYVLVSIGEEPRQWKCPGFPPP